MNMNKTLSKGPEVNTARDAAWKGCAVLLLAASVFGCDFAPIAPVADQESWILEAHRRAKEVLVPNTRVSAHSDGTMSDVTPIFHDLEVMVGIDMVLAGLGPEPDCSHSADPTEEERNAYDKCVDGLRKKYVDGKCDPVSFELYKDGSRHAHCTEPH